MSGGSHNYSYHVVEEMGRALLRSPEPYRKAFGKHLLDVAEAMHDVEWVDSGDMSDGQDKETIMNCITSSYVLESLVTDAQMMVDELQAWIYEVKGV